VVGIGIVVIVVGIFVGLEFADEDGRIGEAADSWRGVVHAAEVLSNEEVVHVYNESNGTVHVLESNYKLPMRMYQR
jgi:hypothetical protein